jgi:malonyl-CoA O-methyltransferase
VNARIDCRDTRRARHDHGASVEHRFSLAARTYDRWCVVQASVARSLMAYLEGVPPPERILEIGCGTGILTELLCARFPEARVTAIDRSPGMIERARGTRALEGRVTWHVADVLDLGHGAYPLVASSSALHWVTPLDRAFAKVRGFLERGGYFVGALMLRETLAELHAARERVAPAKAVRARLPAESEVVRAIAAAGLTLEAHRTEVLRTHHESAWALLRSLHEAGVTGGDVSSAGARLTRGELAALAADYDRNYGAAGGVVASHEVLYARAVKAP